MTRLSSEYSGGILGRGVGVKWRTFIVLEVTTYRKAGKGRCLMETEMHSGDLGV
jgi:hypothetical protein